MFRFANLCGSEVDYISFRGSWVGGKVKFYLYKINYCVEKMRFNNVDFAILSLSLLYTYISEFFLHIDLIDYSFQLKALGKQTVYILSAYMVFKKLHISL